MHHFHTQMVDRYNPTFKVAENTTSYGVDNLNPSLTINGTTVTPTYRYKGGDADGTDFDAWTYGQTVNLQAGSSPSFNQGSPCLGDNDDCVMFNAGGYYQATNTTYGDFTTGDLVFEAVFKTADLTTTDVLFGKRDGANAGYIFLTTNGAVLRVTVEDADGHANAMESAVIDPYTWYHAMFFVNRNEASANGAQWYINGTASGAGSNPSSSEASLANISRFEIGSYNGGTASAKQCLAYIATWEQADWHQAGAAGPAEWATIAAERFARLTGTYPQFATGTALPTTATRASQAYIDKMESTTRSLYLVGDNWIRTCSRNDDNGKNIKGWHLEYSMTNLCLRSETFGTTWTKLDAGDTISSNVIAAPNKEVTADSLIADATNGDHGVTQNITLTAASYIFSVWAKAGDKTWLYLTDTTVVNCYAYFDLSTPAVGTKGAGCAASYIEDYGNGWVRCEMELTGTVAAHTFNIQTADADNDKTVTGDGVTTNLYLWGAQCELPYRKDIASTYIATTGASATRDTDSLIYKADDGNITNNQTGALSMLMHEKNNDNAYVNYFMGLHDNTDFANDRIIIRSATGDGSNIFIEARATGGSGVTEVNVDVIDGLIHKIHGVWVNSVNRSQIGSDYAWSTTINEEVPDDLDVIAVGMYGSGALHVGALINNVKIYNRPTKK